MGGRLARCVPIAASLLGHAALLAAVAGAGFIARPAAAPLTSVFPVRRAPDVPAAGAQLRLDAVEPGAGVGAGETTVPLDTADPRYRPYLIEVRRRIRERWDAAALPGGAAARGALVVEFTLSRGGGLVAADVREPSGHPALDRAALDAVARAVPFEPLPESIAGPSLRIRARFLYD